MGVSSKRFSSFGILKAKSIVDVSTLQLNKGEALHFLRQFIFFADEGKIKQRQAEDQSNQASCLNLVTNAVVTWNTVYMAEGIEQFKREGYPISEDDLAHISPARHEHINPYGKYSFNIEKWLNGRKLRPLRQPPASP
jgi:hypothetical protein